MALTPRDTNERIEMAFSERQSFYFEFYTTAYSAWGGAYSDARSETRGIVVKEEHSETLRRHQES
jgi:hypothetical protein